MKRFVAALMLAGSLMVAGGANATNYSVTYTTGAGFTPSTVYLNQNDTITITNNNVAGGIFFGSNSDFNPTAQGINGSGATGIFTLVVATNASITQGSNTLNVLIGSPPTPSAVPSLSEWTQLLLALMVMTVIGWHFHRERSY